MKIQKLKPEENMVWDFQLPDKINEIIDWINSNRSEVRGDDCGPTCLIHKCAPCPCGANRPIKPEVKEAWEYEFNEKFVRTSLGSSDFGTYKEGWFLKDYITAKKMKDFIRQLVKPEEGTKPCDKIFHGLGTNHQTLCDCQTCPCHQPEECKHARICMHNHPADDRPCKERHPCIYCGEVKEVDK